MPRPLDVLAIFLQEEWHLLQRCLRLLSGLQHCEVPQQEALSAQRTQHHQRPALMKGSKKRLPCKADFAVNGETGALA